MTYTEIAEQVKRLYELDPCFLGKADIACAVQDSELCKAEEVGFEIVCARIAIAYYKASDCVDLWQLCHVMKNAIEDGRFEGPTKECIDYALEYSTYAF